MVFEFGVSNPRFKHQILLEDGFRIIENRRFFRTCALHTILQRKAASERRLTSVKRPTPLSAGLSPSIRTSFEATGRGSSSCDLGLSLPLRLLAVPSWSGEASGEASGGGEFSRDRLEPPCMVCVLMAGHRCGGVFQHHPLYALI